MKEMKVETEIGRERKKERERKGEVQNKVEGRRAQKTGKNRLYSYIVTEKMLIYR